MKARRCPLAMQTATAAVQALFQHIDKVNSLMGAEYPCNARNLTEWANQASAQPRFADTFDSAGGSFRFSRAGSGNC
jgi:hypothetical protein